MIERAESLFLILQRNRDFAIINMKVMGMNKMAKTGYFAKHKYRCRKPFNLIIDWRMPYYEKNTAVASLAGYDFLSCACANHC